MPIAKYISPLTIDQLATLRKIAGVDFSTFNESDVREEFLVPLIVLLGYERGSDYQVLREQSYNLNPFFLKIGSTRIKLDYRFNVYKAGFWLLEAKSGKTPDLGAPPAISEVMVEQAHFYAHHREIDCPLYGVSNGWWINIYDRDSEDPADPILSIRNNELIDRFAELQALIGAAQVTFWIKRRLLSRVEQVLCADLDLARGDEFVREVANAANRARPRVLENFRRNARLQEAARSEALEQYLNTTQPYQVVDTFLLSPLNNGTLRSATEVLARKVAEFPGSNQHLFFDRLLIIEPRPVTTDYYFNSLNVLAHLCRLPALEKVDFPVANGKCVTPIRDHFANYAELLLFHLSARPELRVIMAMESLVKRITKRLLLSTGAARDAILGATHFERYLRPEEETAYFGPSAARSTVQAVEAIALAEIGQFFTRYYRKRNREFDLHGALTEFRQRQSAYEPFEAATDQQYSELKTSLGDDWSELTGIDSVNRSWDRFGAGVCDVLYTNRDLLPCLSSKAQERFTILSRLGNTSAFNCAESLGLLASKELYPNHTERLEIIFDPGRDLRE